MLFAVLCSLQELKGIKTYIFGCIKNKIENKKKKKQIVVIVVQIQMISL